MQIEWFDSAQRGDHTFIKDNLDVFARKQDKQGKSALIIAIQHGNDACIDLLINRETQLETKKGLTAIMYAIHYDNMEAFKKLLPSEGTYLTKKNIIPLYFAIQCVAHKYVALLLPYYAKNKVCISNLLKPAVSTVDSNIIKEFIKYLSTKQINYALKDILPDHPGVRMVYTYLQKAEKEITQSKTDLKRASSIFRKKPSSNYGMGNSSFNIQSMPSHATSWLNLTPNSKSRPNSGTIHPFYSSTGSLRKSMSGPAHIPPPGRLQQYPSAVMEETNNSETIRNYYTNTDKSQDQSSHQIMNQLEMTDVPEVGGPFVDEEVYEIVFSTNKIKTEKSPAYTLPSPIFALATAKPMQSSVKFSRDTPLMIAARSGDLALAKNSMQYVRHTLENGTTALMIACDKGHCEIATLLYQHEKQMRQRDGRTALMIAVSRGIHELVSLLIESESRYQMDDGKTALMVAAMHGHEGLVPLLLAKEARMTDIQRNTALIYAVGSRQLGMIQLLAKVEAGMKTRNGSTALCFAAVLGYSDVAEILIPYEVNSIECHGRTPLMLACQHQHIEVVKLLATTKMVGIIDTRGCTALMECARTGFIRGVELLREYEGKCQNKEGLTAMMYAASAGNVEIVLLLMDYELYMQSNAGFTALIYALTGPATYDIKMQLAELLGPAEHSILVRKGRTTIDYIRDHCEPAIYEGLENILAANNLCPADLLLKQKESFDDSQSSPKLSHSNTKLHGSGHASTTPGSMSVRPSSHTIRRVESPNAPDVEIGYGSDGEGSLADNRRESPVESASIQSFCLETGTYPPGNEPGDHSRQNLNVVEAPKATSIKASVPVSMSIDSDM